MKSKKGVSASLRRKLRAIRLVVLDVDGVLTDGRITYDPRGAEYKSFDAHDGFGIARAVKAGLIVAIVSGRSCDSVVHRARELGITEVHQSVTQKLSIVRELQGKYDVPDSALCAIGDDLPDLPVLLHAGFSAAPADAVDNIRSAVDYVATAAGGRGAVREVLDLIFASSNLRA